MFHCIAQVLCRNFAVLLDLSQRSPPSRVKRNVNQKAPRIELSLIDKAVEGRHIEFRVIGNRLDRGELQSAFLRDLGYGCALHVNHISSVLRQQFLFLGRVTDILRGRKHPFANRSTRYRTPVATSTTSRIRPTSPTFNLGEIAPPMPADNNKFGCANSIATSAARRANFSPIPPTAITALATRTDQHHPPAAAAAPDERRQFHRHRRNYGNGFGLGRQHWFHRQLTTDN
jgi:hypothetical protein